MPEDPIVEEVRAHREAIATRHGNDILAITRLLQKEQDARGRELTPQEPRPSNRLERIG